ncbi:unnamed protein product [Ceratitis capitata]|uniref:(Mediterranean fruit fly) hypothetical protein n=1 Tax=Ceratitis capitata TaxID=7213 RepID=A0A811URH6_CERCA|nr:unnamed protein product [Ceratitis capitata]
MTVIQGNTYYSHFAWNTTGWQMADFVVREASPRGDEDEAVGIITGEGAAHGTSKLAISFTNVCTSVGLARDVFEDDGSMFVVTKSDWKFCQPLEV